MKITRTSLILALSDQGQGHGTALNFSPQTFRFHNSALVQADIKRVCLSDNNIQIS